MFTCVTCETIISILFHFLVFWFVIFETHHMYRLTEHSIDCLWLFHKDEDNINKTIEVFYDQPKCYVLKSLLL